MAFEVTQVASAGSINFQKGADIDEAGYEAVLIEVDYFEADAPNKFGPRDIARGTATFFKSAEDKSPKVVENAQFERFLAKPLKAAVGKATIVKLGKSAAKPGQNAAWIWNPVDPDVQASVIAWAEARDAALQSAVDEAPDEL